MSEVVVIGRRRASPPARGWEYLARDADGTLVADNAAREVPLGPASGALPRSAAARQLTTEEAAAWELQDGVEHYRSPVE